MTLLLGALQLALHGLCSPCWKRRRKPRFATFVYHLSTCMSPLLLSVRKGANSRSPCCRQLPAYHERGLKHAVGGRRQSIGHGSAATASMAALAAPVQHCQGWHQPADALQVHLLLFAHSVTFPRCCQFHSICIMSGYVLHLIGNYCTLYCTFASRVLKLGEHCIRSEHQSACIACQQAVGTLMSAG